MIAFRLIRPLKMFRTLHWSLLQMSFCEKTEVLKTYLEVIPPHRFLEIVEGKKNILENIIASLQEQIETVKSSNEREVAIGSTSMVAVDEKSVRQLHKYVKRKVDLIPMPMVNRIVKVACQLESGPYGKQMREVYLKMLRRVKSNAQNIPLEEIVELIYVLVKLNRKEYEIMKEVEKVIIQDPIRLHYPYIRKILWSYTHTNFGSSVLYAHISKTLTVGQHQLLPLQLADAAYMLSKVSENATGGYGIFGIAEKHIEDSLPRMDFTELVKASSFMLVQNLGSNKFQIKLEEALYNKYPSKDRLRITDLVNLLKSTSGYFFKFKENALLSFLKNSTIRMAQYAKMEQLENIIWSWGRLGKGDQQVWRCLQEQIIKHIAQFKPRQLAFAYYSVCSSEHSSESILDLMETKFMNMPLEQINEHFLIKFLLGMQKKKKFTHKVFLTISEVVSKKVQKLSNNELASFLKILNQSDLDYSNKTEVATIISTLQVICARLEGKLYTLKLPQIAELAYLWTKLELKPSPLIEKCLLQLSNVMDIPKPAFIKAFFVFTMKQRYEKSLEFLPILEELMKYGPIGYFFSPYEFPLLAFCLFHMKVNGNVPINPKLLQYTQQTMSKISPLILNNFVKKGYEQTMVLIARAQ